MNKTLPITEADKPILKEALTDYATKLNMRNLKNPYSKEYFDVIALLTLINLL